MEMTRFAFCPICKRDAVFTYELFSPTKDIKKLECTGCGLAALGDTPIRDWALASISSLTLQPGSVVIIEAKNREEAAHIASSRFILEALNRRYPGVEFVVVADGVSLKQVKLEDLKALVAKLEGRQ
jgi:hypothetical protein